MFLDKTDIDGAWISKPVVNRDDRGYLIEQFILQDAQDVLGCVFSIAQTNQSVSKRGVLRGIHYSLGPESAVKFVTCTQGAVLDFVVDLRFASKTFGKWTSALLSAENTNGMLIGKGLGHAFLSLEDNTKVNYLVSQRFNPDNDYSINALDKDIALSINLPDGTPGLNFNDVIRSNRDSKALTLQESLNLGLLPN